METDKEKVIKELRRVFCVPCTTANSCVGCLVDTAEDSVRAAQQDSLKASTLGDNLELIRAANKIN